MKQSLILIAVLFPLWGLTVLLNVARLQAGSLSSGGATFIVNSTIDATDTNPGDGVCETAVGNGVCTLRAAVMEANALSDTNIIHLQPGIYTLTIPGLDNGSLSGDLDILGPITVVGAGLETTIIDGNALDRVFQISSPISPLVKLSELTVRNGYVEDWLPVDYGGGILNETGTLVLDSVRIAGNRAGFGGGISNQGSLTLTRSIISDNEAVNSFYGNSCGGGICNEGGRLHITDSVFSHNQVIGTGGAVYSRGFATISRTEIISNFAAAYGAGIYNAGNMEIAESIFSHNFQDGPFFGSAIASGGSLTLTKSLVIDNGQWPGPALYLTGSSSSIIQDSAVVQNQGGGIFAEGGIIKVMNSTISENSSEYFGGGIGFNTATVWITNTTIYSNASPLGGIHDSPNYSGTLYINNSIVAYNNQQNCIGGDDIYSLGHNIDSGTSCGFASSGDQVNTDPLLDPLQNNGGNTLTHALLIGSPAIDMGSDDSCPITDQRGFPRPLGLACDIGAYELFIPTDFIFLPIVLKT